MPTIGDGKTFYMTMDSDEDLSPFGEDNFILHATMDDAVEHAREIVSEGDAVLILEAKAVRVVERPNPVVVRGVERILLDDDFKNVQTTETASADKQQAEYLSKTVRCACFDCRSR